MSTPLSRSTALSVRWALDLRQGEVVEITAAYDSVYRTTITMRFHEFEAWIEEVNAAIATLKDAGFPRLLEPKA